MKKLNFKIAFGLIFTIPIYIAGAIIFLFGLITFWTLIRIISFLGILDATEYLLVKTRERFVESDLKKILKKEKEMP